MERWILAENINEFPSLWWIILNHPFGLFISSLKGFSTEMVQFYCLPLKEQHVRAIVEEINSSAQHWAELYRKFFEMASCLFIGPRRKGTRGRIPHVPWKWNDVKHIDFMWTMLADKSGIDRIKALLNTISKDP